MAGPDGITVEEWRHMPESTPVSGGPHYELLDGEVVETPPPTDAHAESISRVTSLLKAELGDAAVVVVQEPVHLDGRSEPRPDIAVLKPRAEGYDGQRLTSEDICLVVEISDNWIALGYDRGRKAAYYARCGIPECWVVDLLSDQVLLMRSPASGGYRDQRNIRRGGNPLGIETLPGISLPMDEILGNDLKGDF
jgi:Uma2 family endonuclease